MDYQSQNQHLQIQQNVPKCLRCNLPMQPIAQIPIKTVKNYTGDSYSGQKILVFDTFRCSNCRKLEFFDLDTSLPNR